MMNCIQICTWRDIAVHVLLLQLGDTLISSRLLHAAASREVLDGNEVLRCLSLLGNLLHKCIEVRARSHVGVECPVPSLEVIVGPRLDTKLCPGRGREGHRLDPLPLHIVQEAVHRIVDVTPSGTLFGFSEGVGDVAGWQEL